MKKQKLILAISCIGLLLSGCIGSQPSEVVDLDGTAWVLKDLNGINLVDEGRPTLDFESGQISGNSGCNHYGGSYNIEGDRIVIEGLFWTEMACMEPAGVMEQEQNYLDLLQNVDQFKLQEDKLILLNAEGKELTYFSEASATQAAVLNTPEVTQIPSPTVAAPEITSTSMPPVGFHAYRDELAGIGVFLPKGWIVTGILEGEYAILQSYPEDKYVGGERREAGDTKCDLSIRPEGEQIDEIVNQWVSDERTTIVSEDELVLGSGSTARRFIIDSMGRAVVYIAKINQKVVLLTCFGDFSQVDEIAATLQGFE